MEVTEGRLLGGRLHYVQPAYGYRTGIEPVLLAASVPAKPGQRVLEAGTGAGAGLLCLAGRVPALAGTGVEIDPDMADLARRNLAANGLDAFEIVTGDITAGAPGTFDHAFANPPWHDPRSTPSPRAGRQRAKQVRGRGLEAWIAALRQALRTGGTLTLILPASQAGRAQAAMLANGLGPPALTRLLPRTGHPAKLILLTASVGIPVGDRPDHLVLHEADGRYTASAEAILRCGLPLAPGRGTDVRT